MRISDWSSDVCSSDLDHGAAVRLMLDDGRLVARRGLGGGRGHQGNRDHRCGGRAQKKLFHDFTPLLHRRPHSASWPSRSEERRVGKEGCSTCRSRGPTYHLKKNKKNDQHEKKQ